MLLQMRCFLQSEIQTTPICAMCTGVARPELEASGYIFELMFKRLMLIASVER
jgi:hypothetical protein